MKSMILKISLNIILLLTILGALQNVQQVRADLPVHCLAHQIEGTWRLYLDDGGKQTQPSCGHKNPDRNTDHILSFKNSDFKHSKTLDVKLVLPDEVYDKDGKRVGKWSMVYDEGFEVYFNEQNFFAFSRYQTINSKIIPKDDDDEQTQGYESLCHLTFLGWYHNVKKGGDWGCYYAEKLDKSQNDINKNKDLTKDGQQMKIVQRDDLVKEGDKKENKKSNEKQSKDNKSNDQKQKNSQATDSKSQNNQRMQKVQTQQQQQIKQDNSNGFKQQPRNKLVSTDDQNFSQQLNADYGVPDGPIQFSSQNVPEQSLLGEDRLEGLDSNEENLSLYQRFKQQKKIYDVPHTEYLYQDSGIDHQEYFKPDYSFIQLVNSHKTNSPWKARDHEHFKQMTHQQMQNMLGMSRFKQIKMNQIEMNDMTPEERKQYILNKKSSMIQTQQKTKYKLKQKGDNLYDENQDYQQVNTYNNQFNGRQTNFLRDGPTYTSDSQKYEQQRFSQSTQEQEHVADICSDEIDPNTKFPKCFDWRNRNGINYDTPIKKQGECGSCYSVATLSAIESRIRIKSNNTIKPFLSTQGVISCSRYNQGCNGGYPILVSKQGRDLGFFEETCSPYKEKDDFCQEECYNSKVWKVDSYGYVGDNFYGSTNETAMMKEIMENGPIVVAINAAPDLYYYHKGVFITNPTDIQTQKVNHPRMNKWIFTNHAVTAVGWGETLHEGQILKYWILKNSWGEDWGDKGYFKMLRGVNLAAVENQAVYANPVIENYSPNQAKTQRFLKKSQF